MSRYYEEKLPFLLRPENVARYEKGSAIILDRRCYPFEKKYVICKNYKEVVKAISDMVTQSGGPYFAAAAGMILAAHDMREQKVEKQLEMLERAALELGTARPTNKSIFTASMAMLNTARDALQKGMDVEAQLIAKLEEMYQDRNKTSYMLGHYAAKLIRDGDTILTHCWAENAIVFTILAALEQKKRIHVYCDETRPYLQGSRLTADAMAEIGVQTTVICDDMAGCMMQQGKIDLFFSGADCVTRAGHVVNKVGTFQVALCAHYFGIPFYALCFGPEENSYSEQDVQFENRNSEESLFCMGMRTATQNPVSGCYPAFDVTPPEFVSAILTDKGVFSPYNIEDYLMKPGHSGKEEGM